MNNNLKTTRAKMNKFETTNYLLLKMSRNNIDFFSQ